MATTTTSTARDVFPHEPEELTTEYLASVLDRPVESFTIEQIGIGVGILSRLFRVDLTAPDGTTSSVVAKFHSLDQEARANVVAPMNFYGREISFFREIADESPVHTPGVHAAHFDDDSGDFLLILEDLSGLRSADQIQGAALSDATEIIDAIAAHHIVFWGADRVAKLPWLIDGSVPPTPQILSAMTEHALPRALDVFADRLTDEHRAHIESLPDMIPVFFADQAERTQVTFCHGDLRLDNVFFDDHCGEPVVIDWQLANKAPGAYDIAYFLTQSVSSAMRRTQGPALIDRYLRLLHDADIDYPRTRFNIDFARTAAFCVNYSVVSAGQIELANDRAVTLVTRMLDRAFEAVDDCDGLAHWAALRN